MLLLQCDLSFLIKIKFGTLTALSGIALVSQVSVIDMTWALFSWAIVSSSSTFGNKDLTLAINIEGRLLFGSFSRVLHIWIKLHRLLLLVGGFS